MTDEMIRALAKNGGVIQVNFYSAFLDSNFASALTKLGPKMNTEAAAARKSFRT